MKTLFGTLLVFGWSLVVISCVMEGKVNGGTYDPTPGVGDDGVSTDITLTIPGGFSVMGTRALTSTQEAVVDHASVLLFGSEDEVLKNVIEVKGIESGENTPTATFEVKLPGGSYNIVVIANSASILQGAGLTRGDDTYDDVRAALVGSVTGKLFTNADDVIPMWGETGVISMSEHDDITIPLTRSVARIDIGLGKWDEQSGTWDGKNASGETIPFTMTEVYVVRSDKQYQLIPDEVGDGDSPEPSIPSDGSKFTAAESEQGFLYTGADIKSTIYIPEAKVVGTAHTDRIALVVGGKYNNSPNTAYYRVDFSDGSDLMDVVRNTLYRFAISNVSGQGLSTVNDAYNAQSTNMTAGVVDWSTETVGDAHFYGDKSMVLSENPVELGVMSGSSETVSINMDKLEWFELTFGSYKLSTKGTKTVKTSNYTYTLSGSDGQWSLKIDASNDNFGASTTSRQETWSVNAQDLLKFNFTLTQAQATSDPILRAIAIDDVANGEAVASPTSAAKGALVTIVARPDTGYEFDHWDIFPTNVERPTTNPGTFIMPDEAVTVTPHFIESQITGTYAISVECSPSDGGSAVASRMRANEGQEVSIIAVPAPGYAFSYWQKKDEDVNINGSSDNPVGFRMSHRDFYVTAIFKPKKTITVVSEPAEGGTASSSPDEAVGATNITLMAVPNPGWIFDHWEGNLVGGYHWPRSNPYTVERTVSSNETLTACFTKQIEPLSVVPNNSNWGAPTFSPENPTEGLTVTINPTVVSGRGVFVDYTVMSGGVSISNNKFTMPAGLVSIRVNYKAAKQQVVVRPTGDGSITVTSPSGSETISGPIGNVDVQPGDLVVVTAMPDWGYAFDSWYDGGTGRLSSTTTNPSSFVMPEMSVDLYAGFVPVYTMTAGTSGGGGTAFVDKATAKYGETVRFTAIADAGYEFKHWVAVHGGSDYIIEDESFEVEVHDDVTAYATFDKIPTLYTLSAVTSTGVIIAPSPSGPQAAGTDITLTAPTLDGYPFSGWDLNGGLKTTSGATYSYSPTITVDMPAHNNGTATAIYYADEHLLTVSTDGGGSVVVKGGSYYTGVGGTDYYRVPYGEYVSLTAIPGGSYVFDKWDNTVGLYGPDVVSTNMSFTMYEDEQFVAYFKQREYSRVSAVASVADAATITLPAGEDGVVGNYIPGALVTVKADRDASKYAYGGWSNKPGAPSVSLLDWSESSVSFTMPEHYVELIYDVTPILWKVASVTAATGSTISFGTNGEEAKDTGVYSGTEVTYTAQANPGYVLQSFVVSGATDTDPDPNTVTFKMPKNNNVVVKSTAVKAYTITATASNSRSALTVSPSGPQPAGTIITVTAPTSTTHNFTGWSRPASLVFIENTTSNTPTIKFKMLDNNILLTAGYQPKYGEAYISGLFWSTEQGDVNWDSGEVQGLCTGDWRLPTVHELGKLINIDDGDIVDTSAPSTTYNGSSSSSNTGNTVGYVSAEPNGLRITSNETKDFILLPGNSISARTWSGTIGRTTTSNDVATNRAWALGFNSTDFPYGRVLQVERSSGVTNHVRCVRTK